MAFCYSNRTLTSSKYWPQTHDSLSPQYPKCSNPKVTSTCCCSLMGRTQSSSKTDLALQSLLLPDYPCPRLRQCPSKRQSVLISRVSIAPSESPHWFIFCTSDLCQRLSKWLPITLDIPCSFSWHTELCSYRVFG